MKTLYVVRHAKSSWEDNNLSDFERPLNDRGKRDAPRMGKRLKEKSIHPDLMLTSPAERALSTCKRIAEVLNYSEEKIKTDRELYHASEDKILSVIQKVKDQYNSLIIFGHNPGLTAFVNALNCHDVPYIDNIPTCGVVAFSIHINTWNELEFGKGKFLFFDYPKSKEA